MKRTRPIQRGGRLKPRGSKAKRDARHARNFGEEADRVRAMPCLCASYCDAHWGMGTLTEDMACSGSIVAAHVTARGGGGAKGGRFDIVPLCDGHHREAGEAPRPLMPGERDTSKRAAFEARYGLKLRAKADAIALGHPDGLGIRGLAARWVREEPPEVGVGGELLEDPIYSMLLDTYERDALLGWVRRHMQRRLENHAATCIELDGGSPSAWHWVLSVGHALGLSDEVAETLCETARWPS